MFHFTTVTAGSLRTEGLVLAHCLRLQVCHVSPQTSLETPSPTWQRCVSQGTASVVMSTLKINYHRERGSICRSHVKFIARKHKELLQAENTIQTAKVERK